MATAVHEERFTNAIIDSGDWTITEYHDDDVKTYDLADIIDRWNGVVGVSLTIRRAVPLPPQEGG